MCDEIGAVAQLGEHLLCKQGVVGSIPISSTRRWAGVGARWGARLPAVAVGGGKRGPQRSSEVH